MPRRATYGVFLSLVLLSGGALAGPSAVEERRREGELAAAAGQWAAAREKYREALRLADQESVPPLQRAELLGALGLAELSLGRFRDAAEHLSAALEDGAMAEGSLRSQWYAGLNEAKAKVGRLAIGVSPPDAVVELDGAVVGSSRRAYLVHVNPGKHAVRVRKKGFFGATQTVEVDAGQARSISFQLEAAPKDPARAEAAASSVSEAQASSAQASSGPGAAEMLQGAGFVLWLVGTGMAVGFYISSEWADGVADKEKERLIALGVSPNACAQGPSRELCQPLNDVLEMRDSMGTASQVSLAAGLGIGVLTALWALASPSRSSQAVVRVTPEGLGLRATF